ncbi:MAG TPA: DUF3048 domain-containing protein [Tissierellia bacterium]|nr:DUF3048 domain-containing protein [Tissierellia bacterium]
MKQLMIALLVLTLLLTFSCSKKTAPEPVETPEPTQPETVEAETQEPVAETIESEVEEKTEPKASLLFRDKRPIAIMINNHPDARPQAGWAHAKIAYEILVEGKMTRILLLSDADEGVIGPIRSARPAFFEITAEYRALYSHVGNFEYVAESPMLNYMVDWDEFSHGGYFRSDHRYAPHNLYGTMEGVYASAEASGVDLAGSEVLEDHFRIYDQPTDYTGGKPAETISFTYDNAQFLDYRYDEADQAYIKSINGIDVADENTGDVLKITNFIILERPHGKMPNGIHEYVDYLTPGKARLFIQGQEFELDYTKAASEEPMKFRLDGEELVFNPGFVFINVVPEGTPITVE